MNDDVKPHINATRSRGVLTCRTKILNQGRSIKLWGRSQRNGKEQGSISLLWYTEILCTVVVTFIEVGISGHYSSNMSSIVIRHFNALYASFS